MDESLLIRLDRLVTAHTGLLARERDRQKIENLVGRRARRLGLRDPEEYVALLQGDSPAARAEWDEFLAGLTNTESHFFRDAGQMRLLRESVFPELIECAGTRRSLSLWSAGCATGEEAYTLAALALEALRGRAAWSVRVLGTDLNTRALSHAERGWFSRWSFREVDPDLRARYFEPEAGGYRVSDRLRQIVRFRSLNLVRDPFTGPELGDADLILCRNVFIYFDRAAVATVVRKLRDALRPGGYLLTGHAEILDHCPEGLLPVSLPHGVIYRRQEGRSGGVESRRKTGTLPLPSPPSRSHEPRPAPSSARGREMPARNPGSRAVSNPTQAQHPTPNTQHPASDGVAAAERLCREGNYRAAIERLEALLREAPNSFEAVLLAARARASLGDHAAAEEQCRRAMRLNPLHAGPYELLAAIVEETGEGGESARELLKKAIYLSPTAVMAYLDLASIHAREGDAGRARRMRMAALEILNPLAPDTPVGPLKELTAGRLRETVAELLARGD